MKTTNYYIKKENIEVQKNDKTKQAGGCDVCKILIWFKLIAS